MSQCDRILAILADGDWHDHHEFYGFCVLHSRIAELRKRGHLIECERSGDVYRYRLVLLGEATPAEASGPSPVASPSEAEHILDPPPGEPPASLKSSGEPHGADWGRTDDGSPEQLTLEVAA